MLLILASMLIQSAAPPQTDAPSETPSTLDPIWTRTVEAGVEWCAPVGGEPATTLLVCSKKSRLDLIDLRTGQSRLPEPVAVQPGVQFTGETRHVAYVYGPSRVYAFLVGGASEARGDKSGLLWQVAGAPTAQTEGDPEFLTRIIAAKATPSGVLIVRSDGRVAELRGKDGSAPWTHRVRAVANCKLLVHGAFAALLSKHGEAFTVMFYDLRPDPPRPLARTVHATLPIWTALIDEGLVAVWRKRFALIPMEGEPRFYTVDAGGTPTSAAAVGVYRHRGCTSSRHAEADSGAIPWLVLENPDGLLRSYDLLTGELRWSEEELRPGGVLGAWPSALQVADELVIRTARSRFSVWRAATGQPLSSLEMPGALVGAGISNELTCGLFTDVPCPTAPGETESMHLLCQAMRGSPPRSGKVVTPAVQDFLLGPAVVVRDTFWLRGTLVIVEEQRIRAYTLP
jgi:hypothetical protein